ncbi:carbohydrate-binding protein [Paenibacillus sp. 79R4]|uniref:carbohydrate-binding protein n=1 Tax=Paenibacillus sp. 79R4 TaxID=2212847 RepID=UPI0015C053C2|nr:carbohydrate-binding protein [Paenibacillus sp. 79R4]NWL90328.1 carbohydrate-binding protein [Paenibacillus sp. 79R4]
MHIQRFGFISKVMILCLCLVLMWPISVHQAIADGNTGVASGSRAYEAEAAVNSLSGKAEITDCPVCSGGRKVGNLYGGSSLQFNNITAEVEGVYNLRISYISGDSRPAAISVNGAEPERVDFPKTADWNTVGTYDFQVYLSQGNNTILFDDQGGYSPDIDKIVLSYVSDDGAGSGNDGDIGELGEQVRVSKYGNITLTEYKQGFKASNPSYDLLYNTRTGLSQYNWHGRSVAKGLYSEVKLDRIVASIDYEQHIFEKADIKSFQDATGSGIKLTVSNEQQDLPKLQQIYYIYNEGNYLLTEINVSRSKALGIAEIAPVVLHSKGGIDLGSDNDNRVLVVPFDNDNWSRYQAKTINTFLNTDNYTSSELTAIYDNTSRIGLVLGSVTHDIWKTGIAWSGTNDKLNKLRVYGGFTSSASTHDSLPHGVVTGQQISSPKVLIGYYSDYRDGLEEYGRINAAIAPPLAFGQKVPTGVPVGWNSWGAYDSGLSYEKAVAVSNYFKANLQNASFENEGNLYINLDSYWDNMTDQQLSDLVKLIHNNGQRAGIYYSPFVYWGDNMNQEVEGTNGKYTYGDIVLRDPAGNILPKLDGAYAVDPTHPGTKQRIDYYMNRFKQQGFEYMKIDFLSHGALEAKHYDPQIETGIQAYNQGMAYVNKALDGTMFISASIAPLFPSQYAHSRRISCDVDGSLGSTEYQLNNLTYGWWQNGTIYHYTDPDYMHLTKGGSLEGAQSRVNAAVISGTVYLNSDDVLDGTAQQYMKRLLTNPRVNELAVKGKAFKAVEGNTGTQAADMFVLAEGQDTYYLAVFNYTQDSVGRQIDLARAGVTGNSNDAYMLTDIWTGENGKVNGVFDISLKPAESKLYKLQRK